MSVSAHPLTSNAMMIGGGVASKEKGEEGEGEDMRQPSVEGLHSPSSPSVIAVASKQGKWP